VSSLAKILLLLYHVGSKALVEINPLYGMEGTSCNSWNTIMHLATLHAEKKSEIAFLSGLKKKYGGENV